MKFKGTLSSIRVIARYPYGFVCSLMFMVFGMLGDTQAAGGPTCLTYPTQFLLPALYRYAAEIPTADFGKSTLLWPTPVNPTSPFYGIISGEVFWNSLGAGKSTNLLTFYFTDPAYVDKGIKFILTGLSSTSFKLSATDLSNSKQQDLYTFATQEAFFLRVGLDYAKTGEPSVQILRTSGGGTFDSVLFVTDTNILATYAPPKTHPSFTVTIGGTKDTGDFIGSLYNFQLNYQDTEAINMAAMVARASPAYSTTSTRQDFDRIYANPDPFYAVHRWDTACFATKHVVLQEPNFSGLSVFMERANNGSSSDPLTLETDNGISLTRFGFAENRDSRIADHFRSTSTFQHVLTTRLSVVFGPDIIPVLTAGCTTYMSLSDDLRTHILYGFKFNPVYSVNIPLASQVWAVLMRVVSCTDATPDLQVGVQFFLKTFGSGAESPASPPTPLILSSATNQNNITVAFELSSGLVSRDIEGKARVYANPEGANVLAADISFTIVSTTGPGSTYAFTDFIGNFADDAPAITYFPLFRLVYRMAQYSTGQLLTPDEACEAPPSKLFIGNKRLGLTALPWNPIVCSNPTDLPAKHVCVTLQPTGSCKLMDGVNCRACNHGYYNASGTCAACGTGCERCDTPTNCKRCFKGFYKNGPNCFEYSTVKAANNLYYPAGQALVITGVQPEWAPNVLLASCALGAYYCQQNTYTLAGTSLYTLVMTFELEAADAEAFRSFGSAILLLANVPVAYNVLNSKNDVAILTYYGTDVPPGTYSVEVRAYGQLRLLTGKVAFTAHDYSVPCLFSTSNSRCLSCNYHQYRFDNNAGCVALGPATGVGFKLGYQGFQEYIMNCNLGVARCKPNEPAKAYACIPGYFLSVDACIQCTFPCDTCSTTATTCQSCKPGYVLNPAGVAPYCLTNTCQPEFFFNPVTAFCEPCVAPCKTCSSATSCSTCIPGYTVSGTQCNINCAPGFYRNTLLNVCQQCSDSCMACTSNLDCTSCSPGFTVDQTSKKCVSGPSSGTVKVDVQLSWNKLTKVLSISFSHSLPPNILDSSRAQLKYNTTVISIDDSFRKSSDRTNVLNLKVEYLLSKTEVFSESVVFSITAPIQYTETASSVSSSNKRLMQQVTYQVPVQDVKLPGGISYYQDSDSARAVQTTAKVVTTSAVAVSSVVALAQGGGSLTALIKLTQYTEALLLTNTDFPSNFRKFIAGFSGYFVQVLTNPLSDFGYSDCSLPDPFVADGFNCLYIQNNNISMIVFACFVFFKLLVWVTWLVVAKFGKHPKFLIKINGIVNTNLFVSLLDSAVFDLTLPALMNLQTSFLSDAYSLANIMLSIFSILLVTALVYTTWIVSRNQSETSSPRGESGTSNPEDLRSLKSNLSDRNPEVRDQGQEIGQHRPSTTNSEQSKLFARLKAVIISLDLKFVSEGFKETSIYGKNKILMVQIFTILTSFSLAFMSRYPLVQLIMLATPQTCLAFATLWSRPYESRLANFKEGVVELLLAIASIISVTLVSQPQVLHLTDYEREAKIGFTLIVVVGIIFFLMFLCSVIEGFLALKEYGVNFFRATKVNPALKAPSTESLSHLNRPGSSLSDSRVVASGKPKIFWPSSKGISTTPKSNIPQTGWTNKVKVAPVTSSPKFRHVKMVKPE